MADRTINFGESETEATYQIQDTDSTGGGNFVLARDTNANTVLLQYDPATDTWEYAGDVDMNGGNVSGVGTLTADSVNTERIGSERHFAGAYDGDDIDTRLDNAIAAADLYDTIYLENGGYSSRNLNKRLVLVGTGGIQNSGSSNSGGEWVFDDRILLTRFTASSDITINSKRCQLEQIGGGGGTVTINANGVGVFNSRGIDVSFASGTANGAANGLYDGSSVSDPDGNNEIGTVI